MLRKKAFLIREVIETLYPLIEIFFKISIGVFKIKENACLDFLTLSYSSGILNCHSASLAQSAEHNHGKVGVSGSIPLGSFCMKDCEGGLLWQKRHLLS